MIFVKYTDTLEYLLQKGTYVDDVDSTGESALYMAYFRNIPAKINILLKYGAYFGMSGQIPFASFVCDQLDNNAHKDVRNCTKSTAQRNNPQTLERR